MSIQFYFNPSGTQAYLSSPTGNTQLLSLTDDGHIAINGTYAPPSPAATGIGLGTVTVTTSVSGTLTISGSSTGGGSIPVPSLTTPSGIATWSGNNGSVGLLNNPILIDNIAGDLIQTNAAADHWIGYANNYTSLLPTGMTYGANYDNIIVQEAYVNFFGTSGLNPVTADSTVDLEQRGSGTYNYPEFALDRSRFTGDFQPTGTTNYSVSGIIAGDDIGHLGWWGSVDTSGNYANGAYIRGVANEKFNSTGNGTRIEMAITEYNATTKTTKVAIDASGQGYVGTTASPIGSVNSINVYTNTIFSTGSNAVYISGSVVAGALSYASGTYSHAEGFSNTASANYTHAEGSLNFVKGQSAHAEGTQNFVAGGNAHAEGSVNVASGSNSHVEGNGNMTFGGGAHAEGNSNKAFGLNSHVEGENNVVSGVVSHVQGESNVATGNYSFAAGWSSNANAHLSVAWGALATAQASGSWILKDSAAYAATNNTANSLQLNFTGGVYLGQTLLGGSNEITVSFGSTPTTEGTFTIVDTRVLPSTYVNVTPSATAPSGRTADDYQWDAVSFTSVAASGSFTVYAKVENLSSIVGNRTIRYSFL